MIRTTLLIAVLAWPAMLAAALVDRFDQQPTLLGTTVYVAASRVCHQRPDRSFHTDGHQWPVCARCAGLYLAAPFGALLGVARRRIHERRTLLVGLTVAALPTAATWLFEMTGGHVGSTLRALAAVPLGAALIYVIVSASSPAGRGDRID